MYKDIEKLHQHNRDYINNRYAQRLSKGLYALCGGKPVRVGMSHCEECGDKQKQRIRERHKTLKEKAVAYLCGKCIDCGLQSEYAEVYDFHHRNPEEKSMGVTKMIRASKRWEAIREELDKCVLLCANCHRIRHAKENRMGDE